MADNLYNDKPREVSEEFSNNTLMDRAKTLGALGVVAAEVSPANEAMRYLAAGTAQAINGDPMVVAATFAGATLLIEGGAALATAHLLDREGGKKATAWINKKLGRFNLEGSERNIPAEASVAYLGGSAVVMLLRNLQSPDMDKEQNKRFGLKTAVALSAVLGVQGYMVSKGIGSPDLSTIAMATGSVSIPLVAANRIVKKKKLKEGQ